MENKSKKIYRLLGKILFVFIVGSGGALLANYYIFPKLGDTALFSRVGFLKRFKENVTIINKTEDITVKEDSSVSKVASQSANTVATIISVSKDVTKKSSLGGTRDGNGVIVTGDGLIATYRDSILEKNANYKVVIFNGTGFDATLLGIDEFTNLAFLKIDASNLPTIPFANSDDYLAGKKMIAIGNSDEAYHNKFASGLLSNVNKVFNISGEAVSYSGKMEGVFESDFINQKEYLGSPVIDYNGELGGIVGSVRIDNQDKYFLIPANQIKRSIEKQIRGELNQFANLGIYYISLTKKYSLTHDTAQDHGALIFSASGKQGLAIIANSPAEKAGLKINDIVTKVGDQEVDLDHPLSNLISDHKKGEEVNLTINRSGQDINVTVKF